MNDMFDDYANAAHAGKHLLLDLYDCNVEGLSPDDIRLGLEKICTDIGATVLFSHAHEFDNGGSSGVVILAESHCTWHHWIDERFIAVDLFVCGSVEPTIAIGMFKELFRSSEIVAHNHRRGLDYIRL